MNCDYVLFPCSISEPAGFPRVSVSPVISIRSSINWKQSPIFSPHSAMDLTTSCRTDNFAPVIAQVSNMADVFSNHLNIFIFRPFSLFSNSISIICPSATLLTISRWTSQGKQGHQPRCPPIQRDLECDSEHCITSVDCSRIVVYHMSASSPLLIGSWS